MVSATGPGSSRPGRACHACLQGPALPGGPCLQALHWHDAQGDRGAAVTAVCTEELSACIREVRARGGRRDTTLTATSGPTRTRFPNAFFYRSENHFILLSPKLQRSLTALKVPLLAAPSVASASWAAATPPDAESAARAGSGLKAAAHSASSCAALQCAPAIARAIAGAAAGAFCAPSGAGTRTYICLRLSTAAAASSAQSHWGSGKGGVGCQCRQC